MWKQLTVQEVGRLVEDDDVGLAPGGGTENDLDLLATETTHDVVRSELALETEVLEVLLDLLANKRTIHAKSLGRLLSSGMSSD